MKRVKCIDRLSISFLFLLPVLCMFTLVLPANAQVATTTTLLVTPACTTEGCVITLTASVNAGGSPVHPGLVSFCDKGPQNCENEAPVGRAQLTANGTATIRIGLAAGSHSLRAVFHGTKDDAASISSSQSVTVITGPANRVTTGGFPPTSTGANGDFSFAASLNFLGSAPPTGTISFLDTSQNNLNLGSVPIATGPISQSYISGDAPFGAFTDAAAIVPGDFNNDGFEDILELDQTGNLEVGLGDGKGNFTQAPAFTGSQTGIVAPNITVPVISGDFNSDGKLDIALPDITSNLIHVFLGNGDGTFTAAASITVSQNSQQVVAGDFNNDGIPDLLSVSTQASSASYLQVLLGNGDGTFTAQPAITFTNENLVTASVGDFNHDGKQDIALAYYSGTFASSTPADTLAILEGNGDGTFAASPAASIPQSFSILATGDFDGDGIPDIMTGGLDSSNTIEPGTITFFHSNGNFTFTNTAISQFEYPAGFIPGDYLGNGTLQVNTSFTPVVNIVQASTTNGLAIQALPVDGLDESAGTYTLADFNNDGFPDLVSVFYGFQYPQYQPTVFASSFTSTSTTTSPGYALSEGIHNIAASYSGDANHDSNVSPPVEVYSTGVNYASGFGASPALALNGATMLNSGVIQLTGGGEFQAGSFFTNYRIDLSNGIVSNFEFQIPGGNADGFAFVLQANGPNAIGSSGGGLGYGNTPGETSQGITNSVALAFDLHNNQGEGSNSVRVEFNGVTSPSGAVDLTPSAIDLHSGHLFQVQVLAFEEYSSAYFYVTITDTQTKASFIHEFSLGTTELIPGDWAYVGFTSGSGTSTTAPAISNWTIDSQLTQGNLIASSASTFFPNGFTGATGLLFNGGSAISGAYLELTKDTPFEATSTYYAYKEPALNSNFTTDFDFNVGDGNGDGFTFVLQDGSQTAVGSSGGGLGYGVDYLGAAPAYLVIPNSLAIKFDLHNNQGEGINSTGLYINGASPTTPSIDLTSSGINLHSGHNFHARISRTASDQITLTITDLNVYKVFQTTFTVTNASVLQEGSVYAGFTAGTGATSDTIKILNWTLAY